MYSYIALIFHIFRKVMSLSSIENSTSDKDSQSEIDKVEEEHVSK